MLLRLDSGVHSIDLSSYVQYVSWHHLNAYFPMEVGENHHKLLAYLVSQLDSGLVCDLGTQFGASALALSYNKNVQVMTYDIHDHIPSEVMNSYKQVNNIQFVCASCFHHLESMRDAKIILLDISPHNGQDEQRVLEGLKNVGFKGLLICDDIYSFDGMVRFFREVKEKKFDVTPYGHHSGTGIIIMDEQFIDLEVH